MPHDLLPSEARLERAMGLAGLLRANNPPSDRWTLSMMPPGTEAQWSPIDSYGQRKSALDDALDLRPRPAPGTVLRVEHEGTTSWVGVTGPDGLSMPAGPLPRRRSSKAKTWIDFWFGPEAQADWMLNACERVEDRRRITLAVIACARRFSDEIEVPDDVYRKTLDVAERSCRDEATRDEVRAWNQASGRATSPLERAGLYAASYMMLAAHYASDYAVDRRAVNRHHNASQTAVVAATAWGMHVARNLPRNGDPTGAYATALDRGRVEALRALAKDVRDYLWLGDALLAVKRK